MFKKIHDIISKDKISNEAAVTLEKVVINWQKN